MATIIDTLIVKLGLDASEYDSKSKKVDDSLKNTGDQADKTGKKLKDTGTEGSKSFDEVAKSATKFLAILGGTVAIKRFVEQTITSNASLFRFSQNLQESANIVSAWSNASVLAGGTADGLISTMDMLSQSQTELLLTGQSGLIPYFSALGVSMATAEGKARPVSDILLDLSDRFSKMDRTTANNMGRMMGIDQGTMQLLLKGRKEVELLISRQKEYGAVTKKQAEESERLRQRIVDSTQTFRAWGRELLSSATPAIEKVLSILEDFGRWARQNEGFVNKVLTVIAAGLVAIGVAAIPINLTAVAILGLAAGVALLWDDYQKWAEGADSAFDWSNFASDIGKAKEAFKSFADILGEEVFFRIFALAGTIQGIANHDLEATKIAWGLFKKGGSSAEDAPVYTGPSSQPKTGSAPRGIRNNNPGNLNFAGQAGATKESGPNARFAKFDTMKEGVAALVRQIGLYVNRGKNTIRQIIETYAPSSENNTGAYISAVSKALGIGADDQLDINDSSQVKTLVRAIINHENGAGYVKDSDIVAGMQMAGRGIKGASQAAAGAGAGNVASLSASNVKMGDSSVETHIGEVNIHTQATDATGIAKDMGQALNYLFVPQSNYGTNG